MHSMGIFHIHIQSGPIRSSPVCLVRTNHQSSLGLGKSGPVQSGLDLELEPFRYWSRIRVYHLLLSLL